MTQCGLVSPFWVRLGLVRWHGYPEPEPQFNIEYRRCTSHVAIPTERGGFVFPWCSSCAATMTGAR